MSACDYATSGADLIASVFCGKRANVGEKLGSPKGDVKTRWRECGQADKQVLCNADHGTATH